MKKLWCIFALFCFFGCKKPKDDAKVQPDLSQLQYSENILDYTISPKHAFDKDGLMFSDQGAWFAYSFPEEEALNLGFSGPFLMTQQNGVWSSEIMPRLGLSVDSSFTLNTTNETIYQHSYASHLAQKRANEDIEITETLVFLNGNTSLIKYDIKNKAATNSKLFFGWSKQEIFADSLSFKSEDNILEITSGKSKAKGVIIFPKHSDVSILNEHMFTPRSQYLSFAPNEVKSLVVSQTYIFPEYSWENERKLIESVDFDSVLAARKLQKNSQLSTLISNRKPQFQDEKYAQVLAKAHLTLQNNWRVPAGEIKHEGLFPSYHYKWFNGFWSWDSWKHAVGLSYYDLRLAKEQVKLMFNFQNDDGFVADCVFRDTLIERHNYRDTKPPLSAWAVSKIYKKDKDLEFVKHMYPKLKKYHYWWYQKRDHDQDGICEYGSTDGSLVAAKWESGMDNAIRFDNSKIVKNSEGAYSLNQESVDLNAYLYAEKLFLSELAATLGKHEDNLQFNSEATKLKNRIQQQFYDPEDGWFYDTNLEGDTFIKGEGSEGWTALWAKAAKPEQAQSVRDRMMDPEKFFTKIPFQTMSADHEKFDPLKGYWRGPNWLDQAYFGVKSLRNYGFNSDADKATIQILEGAEGLLGKGKSIRENYHPLTGKGLHAHNFSWSAAHIIMLLLDD